MDFVREKIVLFMKAILFLFVMKFFFFSKNNSKISNKKNILRHPSELFKKHKLMIEAHRGVNLEVYQNTMEAFARSIDYGLDVIETDAWLTKDKVLVLVHGGGHWGNIKRYYNISKTVKSLTWKEISKFRTVKDNLKMPRLSDLFKLAKNKIIINLEIKDPRINLTFSHIMKLIEKYDFFEQIYFTSFYFEYYNKTIEYNKKHNKNIIFEFAYEINDTNYDYTKKGNILSIYNKDITKETCDKAHANGMAVLASFRNGDKESGKIYKKLVEDGVDIISVNRPLLAKKFVKYYYKEN